LTSVSSTRARAAKVDALQKKCVLHPHAHRTKTIASNKEHAHGETNV
jgi:hypothetical protein